MSTKNLQLLAVAFATAAISTASTHDVYASALEEPFLRVSNGEQAKECVFPGVVLLRNCTGTLVHPKVVVYAAHCGKRQTVRLTHASGQGVSLPVERCNTNPKYGSSSHEHLDWAYCVLKEEATDWPIIPVATGCETDLLAKSGASVVQCGFGQSNDGGPRFGRKRFAASKISSVSAGEITVGDAGGVVACPGDSGGPLLGRLEDGSWRTIGITSTYNGRCGSGGMNTYANIKRAIRWIETDSGIDITPCFNDDGDWEPGPKCGGFYAGEMGSTSGTWSNACEGSEVSGPSSTCGPVAADTQAPVVSLKLEDQDSKEEPATLNLVATATDDRGVVKVKLLVDGKVEEELDEEPFSFKVEKLAAGTYTFTAKAFDKAGNEAESEPVEVEIKESEKSEESEDKSKKKKDDEESENKSENDEDEDEDGEDEKSDGDSDEDEKQDPSSNAVVDCNKPGCALTQGGSRDLWLFFLGLSVVVRRKRKSRQ